MVYNFRMSVGRPAHNQRTGFGERLYHARLAKGLSQMEMAQLLGITQQAYASWERKPTALKPEQLVIIATKLDVSIDSLLDLDTKAKSKSGPVGKLQLLLEEASKLPRSQQNKISEFLEPFVKQHSSS
jgi:transcriptional regulator with XRE-family HTH domain